MELIDVTPEIRRLFLEQVADECKIGGKERILFLCRFDYQNKKCKDTEIFEQLNIDKSLVSTPRKNLASIYNKLGFPRTKNGRGASPKGESPFNKASDWLWIEKFNEWLKLQQNPNVQIPILNDDEWLKGCHTKLEDQQKQIRKNASAMKFELDFPPVPLGLVERKDKEKQQPRGDDNQEKKPKIYEHNDFLEQVINQNTAGKNNHIAIVGEPGAGKTTLLTAIASYIKNENKELPIVISLGSLQGMTLEEYILKKWLPDTMRLVDITPTSEIEEQLKTRFYKGGIWLLLDGVDEMGESSPTAALQKISQALTGWLGKPRVVLTCRLNVWDANPLYNDLSGFDTYKTQEFKPEQIDEFIEEWFKCDNKIQRGEELKTKLREPGKERIRELVTNPLRLCLLCQIFYQDKHRELPETKAGLFDLYAKYFYYWKSIPETQELRDSHELQKELHQVLGKLALEGINSDARFRMNKSFVVEVMTERLFNLARDVGWLNLVDRDVYAFFHPNFQEYFAALVIDDWHDFFNHNNANPNPFIKHNNQDCIYRIFDLKWKEVILLWFGRREIEVKNKEEFIYSLITFNDGCGRENFYDFKCYFLAAAAIAEFSQSKFTHEVIQKLIKWGFGELDNQQNQKDELSYEIQKSSKLALQLIHDETTTSILKKYVVAYRDISIKVIDYLTEVGIGNESIIEMFISLLHPSKLFTYEHIFFNNKVIRSLGEIGIGSERAITRLLETAHSIISMTIYIEELCISSDINSQNLDIDKLQHIKYELNDYLRDNLESLGKIGIGNQGIIAWLQKVINFISDEELRIQAANTLWKINPGDILAINILEEIIYNHPFDYVISFYLEEISKTDAKVIDVIIKILFKATHQTTIQRACQSLGRIGFGNIKSIEALVKIILISKDNETCRIACESLGEIGIGNPNVIEALTKILANTQDEYVKRQAADSLLKINPGNFSAIQELINLLHNSKDIWLRLPTAISLYKNGSDTQKIAVVEALEFMLKLGKSNYFNLRVAETIHEINPDNKAAIETLIHLACVPFDDGDIDIEASKNLCTIGNNNPIVIELLIKFLQSEINEYNRIKIVKILSEIDSQNPFLIKQITNLIDEYSNIEALEILASINPRHSKVMETLRIIIHDHTTKFQGLSGISIILMIIEDIINHNYDALDIILNFFFQKEYSSYLQKTSNALQKIQKKELLFQVVARISDHINKPIFNQDHDYYDQCYKIFWHCAQNMTYPEFYRAWYGEPSPIQNLENQFTDTHSQLSQLQQTEKTYPLTLNLKTLQNETDIIEISQEICNQIYFTACPENPEIPPINNAPQLKSKIPQIKKHLQTENLALIINNCEPNQEMIKFCNKLTDVLHIAFITEQPLDAPLKGFPNQPNLLNIIQHWINEIG
jgi:HEAT repeat protein/GTPase SAR1 family protein